MNRVSGSLAVLAGFFLFLPGLFTVLHAASSTVALPAWLVRDLVVFSIGGAGLFVWGLIQIRHREIELQDAEPVRVRAQR